MKNNLMLIGEMADFFGISRKAMRLYEKKGIIKPVKADAENGYRYYSAERAWLLVKMVCIEEVRAEKVLSEAL